MKLRPSAFRSLVLTSLMLLACWPATAQLNRRLPFLPDFLPDRQDPAKSDTGISPDITAAGLTTATMRRPFAEKRMAESNRLADADAFADRATIDQNIPEPVTIPHWSGSFDYHGLEYNYTMVGTDPKRGSTQTVIPAVLIPLRFLFGDGSVYDASTDIVDGQTPIQAILNSPIFQSHNYVIGGTSIGSTQYGDAFQRANFWSDVSHGSHNYHVLLGGPAVTPLQTINVPTGKFSYRIDPATNQVFPEVVLSYIQQQLRSLIQNLNVSPTSLPIFVTGTVSEVGEWGYHFSFSEGGIEQTYIAAPYLPQNTVYLGQHVPDTYILSHEIVEWMNDPFTSHLNYVPGWEFAGDETAQCDSSFYTDLLEVGDPLVFSDSSAIPISINSFTYHVTDAAFLDFFTRSNNSRSVNGQYSFFGSAAQPTPPCVGHLEISRSSIAFPGATSTLASGINNKGQIVGSYRAQSKTHGFLLDGAFTSLDFPGATGTLPQRISDSGVIVGYYTATTGLPHGFLYQYGVFVQIDFPGAVYTVANGINSAGDVIGAYADAGFNTHSFILQRGIFQSFDSPLGAQSYATAINDLGIVAGINADNPNAGPNTGFVKDDANFTPYVVPGSFNTFLYSINNHGDLAGYFLNTNGWTAGVVTLYGYTYQIYPRSGCIVFGNNDRNQIVGRVFDSHVNKFVGFVADLPLKHGN